MVTHNTETQRPEHYPESHLAQISLRKGAREHVLYCDGGLKGRAMPMVGEKMLSCKLLSAAAAFVTDVM